MLVAALLALTLSDSRYVKVEPGFVSEHGYMEMDKLIVSPDGEAVMTSTRHSIDSTSRGVKEFTGQFETGTEITIVFTVLLGHRGDITHSLAGPFVVESGDGVQSVVAKTAVREPIVIRNQNSEAVVSLKQSFLDLPLKRINGELLKNVIDRRQWANLMAVKAPANMWTVATKIRTRFDQETKENALIGVLQGCDYRLRLSADGHDTSVVSLSSTDDQLHVALKETPPLVLKVTDSSGRPMENVRIRYSRCPEEQFRGWAHHRLERKAQNATDADGIARIAKLNGGAKYDIYLDAGRRGRSILQAVLAGTQNSVTLFADPPLTVNLKNLPADAVSLPIEVVEEVPDGGGSAIWFMDRSKRKERMSLLRSRRSLERRSPSTMRVSRSGRRLCTSMREERRLPSMSARPLVSSMSIPAWRALSARSLCTSGPQMARASTIRCGMMKQFSLG